MRTWFLLTLYYVTINVILWFYLTSAFFMTGKSLAITGLGRNLTLKLYRMTKIISSEECDFYYCRCDIFVVVVVVVVVVSEAVFCFLSVQVELRLRQSVGG